MTLIEERTPDKNARMLHNFRDHPMQLYVQGLATPNHAPIENSEELVVWRRDRCP